MPRSHYYRRKKRSLGFPLPTVNLYVRPTLGNPVDEGEILEIYLFYSSAVVITDFPPFKLVDVPYQVETWRVVDPATVRIVYDADLRGVKWQYLLEMFRVRGPLGCFCQPNAGTFPE